MLRDSDFVVGSIVALIVALLFAGIFGIGFAWESYACENRWKASGMKAEYSWAVGCMIEVTPGKIIPEASYREIPQ